MPVAVIGVGTRRGDDAAGLALAERVAQAGPPPTVRVSLCERPVELCDALRGADAAIVVDALRSGRPPGSLVCVGRDELVRRRALSSHGLGVGDGLRLAEALGRLPARVIVLGVEAGGAAEGEPLSSELLAALDAAAARVRALAAALAAGAEGPPGA